MTTIRPWVRLDYGPTLRFMEKHGWIKFPVHKGQCYVDHGTSDRGSFWGMEYKVEYTDGCFFPFVFTREQQNRN